MELLGRQVVWGSIDNLSRVAINVGLHHHSIRSDGAACRSQSTKNPSAAFRISGTIPQPRLSHPGPPAMLPLKPLFPILWLALGAALRADFTYVDATTSNTTLANGSAFNPAPNGNTGNDNNWELRTGFGSGGTVLESGGEVASENAPELKTTLTGLTPGATYRIFACLWDPTNASEDWNLRAGVIANPGANTLFSAADATTELVATAAVPASTLTFSSAPTTVLDSGNRTMLAASIGTLAADGNGQISVYLDDRNAATSPNFRSWYDGLAYEFVAPPSNNVTYVDANASNTRRWDNQTFSPTPDGASGADNNWEIRNLGNAANVYESCAEAAENAPLLVTTLTGLTPNTRYLLYAYFWDATTGNWRIKASVKSSDINNNGTPGIASDDFLPTSPLTHFAADSNDGGLATDALPASNTVFVSNPLFTQNDRVLMEAPLGTSVSDANGNLSIYVDDLAGVDQSRRTWFDGVGYKLALPLTPSADEDGDGLTNGEEVTNGTDPYLADTDGDGYSDSAEVTAGSNPLSALSVPPLPGNSLQMTSDGAWTWFNDERAIFHQGSLFIGYVKSNGQYGVTRYNPATNVTSDMIISTATSQQQDDHNNPSFTVLPDGKLLVLYAKHNSERRFYQRTSLVPLPTTNADWGPEIIRTLTASDTYNNTYLLSGESNRIYNFHRNINFNPTITISDDLGATWQPSIPFIAVGTGGVRPYPRYCSNRTDRIDLIYTDGHPRDLDNSVYHMFYRAGGFYKTDATLIDTFANLPLEHQSGQRGSVVYQFSSAAWGAGQGPNDWIPNARGWTWDVHYGQDGNPVCVFQAQTGTDATWATSRIYYYYARWTGSAWQKRFIAQAGRGIYAAESDYGGGMCLDPKDPNVIYIASNAANPFNLGDINNVPLSTNNRYEIYRGVTSDGGLTFTWTPITTNSVADNFRPIIPENSPYDDTVVWFNGTYNTYTNYSTKVLAILRNDLRMKTTLLVPASNTGTFEWKSSPGWRYRITGSEDLNGFPHTIVSGIESQGETTTRTFTFPPALTNRPKAFFRVETE